MTPDQRQAALRRCDEIRAETKTLRERKDELAENEYNARDDALAGELDELEYALGLDDLERRHEQSLMSSSKRQGASRGGGWSVKNGGEVRLARTTTGPNQWDSGREWDFIANSNRREAGRS